MAKSDITEKPAAFRVLKNGTLNAQQRYYLKNLSSERERHRAYAKEHKEERSKYLKEWREKNRDRTREWERKHYRKNIGKYKAKNRKTREKNSHTPRWIYTKYKHSASRRGYEFSLSMDQFMLFWGKPCYYCGKSIDTIGLDRVDNSVGYTSANVVPCDYTCNIAKQEMGREEFILMCNRVSKAHNMEVK